MELRSAAAAIRRKAGAAGKRVRRAARARREKPFDAAETYTHCHRTLPLEPNLVLYQAHSGAAMACNPYALFVELLDDPRYAHLNHVWVLDGAAELRRRRREYADRPNVRFVKDGSPAYLKALATAGHLIQNTTFSAYFAKRPGQVYVMTWHSAGAVKAMGVDLPEGNYSSRNVVRNLLMADYLVSPNQLMTKVFADSYRMQGIYPGKLLEFGYPRNDVTLRTSRAEVIEELASRGVAVDPAKQIVLYAPTWRGATLGSVRGDAEELEAVRQTIAAGIDTDRYQVLIKPHNYLYSRLTRDEKRSGRFIPRTFNANRLLAAVDILISDYSSIFFDFLVTDRPVLFYLPDLAEYTAERGVYFAMDELPGPVTADAADLAGWINELPATVARHADRYARMKQSACAAEDGHASRRTVEAVFGGRLLPGVTDGLVDPARRRVLLYADELDDTAATRAVLNLEAGLEGCDVTIAGLGHSLQSRANLELLCGRPLVRTGQPTLSRRERWAVEAVRRFGPGSLPARLLRPAPALQREWRRRFGDARFDIVVECSRRPGVFGWLARLNSGAKLVIWQTPAEPGRPAETATPPAEGVARPLGRRSLRRLRQAADAVVPVNPALREWEQLFNAL